MVSAEEAGRELSRRWGEYLDMLPEREQRKALRAQELRECMPLGQVFYQVVFEEFCSSRLFLPVTGLSGYLANVLAGSGFYWEEDDPHVMRVLFPDGWQLVPSDELQQVADAPFIGYLVDPNGTLVAEVRLSPYDSHYWAIMKPL